ncbi:nitrate reductase cytochrome c-type subunit [Bacillus sp. FJAT-29790]|uniref:nitrate reductase cytochrome c-type subunit n=1 Tax=Bacillus sp. FJAT-29790 TaxID=1895002 RepID=UPI001C23FC8B|nr:nitrate reductase cytochrome c-type subunit [Bacillus sp. FJAT-29790]MBU8878370.1 nitrate reductase cytochrome c-type subunit [Bacillus sp. FJAT-29790]
MKRKEILFVVAFMLVVAVAIGTQKLGSTEKASSEVPAVQANTVIPQLTADGREESGTMVLLGAPPMQPADHIDRWNPDLHHESCMSCHAVPATGAPTPPTNHYYDDDIKGTIFRDNCQQCHATQNDTKTAFNDEE